MKSKVIVMYYRQPFKESRVNGEFVFQQTEKPNGILAILKNYFISLDNGVWVASSEFSGSSKVSLYSDDSRKDSDNYFFFNRVKITKEENDRFYYKTCKDGFWPIIHSFPEKFKCDSIDWQNFEMINQRFAEVACEAADEDAVIWIHDYNLWLAPFYIKQIKPAVKIAFFFHTNFPSPDIFNMLPNRKQIITSLLCCDLISFDIPRYLENFVNTARSNVEIEIKRKVKVSNHFSTKGLPLSEPVMTKLIGYNGIDVNLEACPEGTNYDVIKQILKKPSTLLEIEKIKKTKGNCRLIFSASRVDYIKGTLELLKCYERLLKRKGYLAEQIILFIVAVDPGRISGYGDIHNEIKVLVERINKEFGNDTNTPIAYSYNPLKFEDMVAWFHETDIMWIPSLRDGMNIVCKEFIATKKNNGVLILSEFAGASVEMDSAVLVNPYSSKSMDEAIDHALSMPIKEQQSRMKRMFRKMLRSDVQVWSKQLQRLCGFAPHTRENQKLTVPVVE